MNFLLSRRLRKWVDAGLITEEAALRIEEHEGRAASTNVTYAALGIGALAIVVGIISIIAANWYLIPSWVKLTSNISWLISLASALGWTTRNKKSFAREVLALVYFGSILGSIALVGQIYHLDSHPFNALSLWMVLGSPLILLYCESRYAAWLFASCAVVWSIQGQSWISKEFYQAKEIPFFLYLWLYLALAFQFLRLKNEYFSEAFIRIGTLFTTVLVLVSGSLFWRDTNTHLELSSLIINFVLSLILVVLVRIKAGNHLAGIVAGAAAFALLPLMFPHGDLKIAGALFYIALMISVAHYGITHQIKNIFEAACVLIALRIVVIYFEVFGTLLQTGMGLITSGIFIILVVWLWKSKRGVFWRTK